MQTPVDLSVKQLFDLPYTISFCIRKRIQIDSLSELPKDKRPSDKIIWDGTSDDLDDWLDRVLYDKKPKEAILDINPRDIET